MTPPSDSLRHRSRASVASSTTADDYDLAAGMVSDGFRPANLPPSSTSSTPPGTSASSSSQQSSNTTAPAQPNFASLLASRSQPEPANVRPSSTAKPPRLHDSLTIQNDGDNAAEASGPSHPYDMYAQRTTTGVSMPPAGLPSIPATQQIQSFPLYDDDTSLPALPAEQAAPVRFGAANNFPAPMAGAELEPTEDLPPYTRYPEVSMTRKPGSQPAVSSLVPFPASQSSSTTDLTLSTTHEAVELLPQSRPRPSPTPSTVAIPQSAVVNDPGHAARNHALNDPMHTARSNDFSSTQDTLSIYRSRSRYSTSRPSTLSDDDEIEAMKAYPTKPPSKWQRRAKKKLCGVVPYWAICLVAVAIVIICVIMGAVIGTLLPPRPGPRRPPPSNFKPPPNVDADDVVALKVVPADLKPMKTGQFRLFSMKTQQASQNCVVNKTLSSVWSCDVSGWRSQVTISPNLPGTVTAYNMTFEPFLRTKIFTGTQPINLEGRTMPLQLVNDTLARQPGPAWFGWQQYEKVVILDYTDLKLTPTKRGLEYKLNPLAALTVRGSSMRNLAEKDKGWQCSWPDSIVKVMIYPNAPKEYSTPPPPRPTPTRAFGDSSTASATAPSSTSSIPTGPPGFDLQYYLVDKPNCKPDSQGASKPVSCREFHVENSQMVFTGTPQLIDVAPDKLMKQRRDKPGVTVSQCFCEWSS